MSSRFVLACFLMVPMIFSSTAAFAGKVELTTYYPAPMGEYEALESKTVKLVPKTAPVCDVAAEGMMYYDSARADTMTCRNDGTGVYAWQLQPMGHQICQVGGTCYGPLVNAIGNTYYYIAADNTIKSIPRSGTMQGCSDSAYDYLQSTNSGSGYLILSSDGISYAEFRDSFSFSYPSDRACVSKNATSVLPANIKQISFSGGWFLITDLRTACPPPVDNHNIQTFCSGVCTGRCGNVCESLAKTILNDVMFSGYQVNAPDNITYDNEIR